MNFERPNTELRLLRGLINIKTHWGGAMDGRERRTGLDRGQTTDDHKRPQPHGNDRRGFHANYFSAKSFLVLLVLTASLLLLPLVLPPLPPPPFMLLLLPVAMLVVLLILALMPSDVRNIASPYL